MQRRTTLILPPEYTQPLDKKVCSALSERRDSFRPFLMPPRLNRRIRHTQRNPADDEQRRTSETTSGPRLWAFGNPAASYTPPDPMPEFNEKVRSHS